MITVQDVFNLLNQSYPVATAMDFDNVGLLVGDRNTKVKRVLVALDCDRTAVQRAIEENCELIVTHHPVIFSGLKSVTDSDLIFTLLTHNIAVISMHTNLDVADGGVNDCLCRAVNLKEIEVYIAEDGYALRRGKTAPISASDFATALHKYLGGGIKFTDGGKPIENVLVCSGSGGNYLYETAAAGCDALITADVKHNVFIDATNNGISLFDAGHFATEDVVVEPLASVIRGHLSVLDVLTHHPKIINFA